MEKSPFIYSYIVRESCRNFYSLARQLPVKNMATIAVYFSKMPKNLDFFLHILVTISGNIVSGNQLTLYRQKSQKYCFRTSPKSIFRNHLSTLSPKNIFRKMFFRLDGPKMFFYLFIFPEI